MIGNTVPEYVFIRVCITGLRLVAPVSIIYLAASAYARSFIFSPALGAICACESAFYLFVYVPRKKRLQQLPVYQPPPMTKSQRAALFKKCAVDFSEALHAENTLFPRGWFLPYGKNLGYELRRQDVVTWLLWALFSCPPEEVQNDWRDELDAYVKTVEGLLGYRLNDDDGDGTIRSMRLTLDPVKIVHRPLIWYLIVLLVDSITTLKLFYLGFKHYSSTRKWFEIFPFRPLLSLFSTEARIYPDILLPYWYRPHKSDTKLPIVFLHGIGIGLHPYTPFIRDLISQDPDVGIILIELLPISMHMTTQPVPPASLIASALDNILDNLNIPRVVLAAHSYGTYVASCILHDSRTSHSISTSPPHPLISKIAHALLIDPIPLLLHLPPVAYNFLHRTPSSAAEWQLWYFASTDPDIARTLGRSFFWTEGVAWTEDLRRWMRTEGPTASLSAEEARRRRNIAVVLAGEDQIVPGEIVRRYLTREPVPSSWWVGRGWANWIEDELGQRVEANEEAIRPVAGGDLEVLYYSDLDHAMVFDKRERWGNMLDILGRFVQDF